jgi:hypothetical protein
MPFLDFELFTPAPVPLKPFVGAECLQAESKRQKVPPSVPRHKFNSLEDQRLQSLVAELGQSNWLEISARLGTRSARQCRERYHNYLDPKLRHGPWSEAEDILLVQKFTEFGPKWALIERFFEGRSEANIKNRWAQMTSKSCKEKTTAVEKRMLIQGLDEFIANAGKDVADPKPILETNLSDDLMTGGEVPWDQEIPDPGREVERFIEGFDW